MLSLSRRPEKRRRLFFFFFGSLCRRAWNECKKNPKNNTDASCVHLLLPSFIVLGFRWVDLAVFIFCLQRFFKCLGVIKCSVAVLFRGALCVHRKPYACELMQAPSHSVWQQKWPPAWHSQSANTNCAARSQEGWRVWLPWQLQLFFLKEGPIMIWQSVNCGTEERGQQGWHVKGRRRMFVAFPSTSRLRNDEHHVVTKPRHRRRHAAC